MLSVYFDMNWQEAVASGSSGISSIRRILLNNFEVWAASSGPDSVIWICNGSCVKTCLHYVDLIPVLKMLIPKPMLQQQSILFISFFDYCLWISPHAGTGFHIAPWYGSCVFQINNNNNNAYLLDFQYPTTWLTRHQEGSMSWCC